MDLFPYQSMVVMVHPKVHSKIEEKLDVLQRLMENQMHIKSTDSVNKALGDLGKYRQYMNDEQADFVDCARFAKDEQMEWK